MVCDVCLSVCALCLSAGRIIQKSNEFTNQEVSFLTKLIQVLFRGPSMQSSDSHMISFATGPLHLSSEIWRMCTCVSVCDHTYAQWRCFPLSASLWKQSLLDSTRKDKKAGTGTWLPSKGPIILLFFFFLLLIIILIVTVSDLLGSLREQVGWLDLAEWAGQLVALAL